MKNFIIILLCFLNLSCNSPQFKNSLNQENVVLNQENLQNEIHKKYLNDLIYKNNENLYTIFIAYAGLNLYWKCFGNYFIDNMKNKDISIKELKIMADQKRNDLIKNNPSSINMTISSISNSGIIFVEEIKNTFNDKFQSEIKITFNDDLIPKFSDHQKAIVGGWVGYYFEKKINIENNSTYQFFVDVENKKCILYLEITININKKNNTRRYHDGSIDLQILSIKIDTAHFVYPDKIQTINF